MVNSPKNVLGAMPAMLLLWQVRELFMNSVRDGSQPIANLVCCSNPLLGQSKAVHCLHHAYSECVVASISNEETKICRIIVVDSS